MGIPLNPNTQVRSLVVPTEGQVESSAIVTVAMDARFEVQTITCQAFAAAGQGDFVLLRNTTGESEAFWLDKDNDETAPATGADNALQVDIVTGDTAAQVATKLAAVINSQDSQFIGPVATAVADGATVVVTHEILGAVIDGETFNSDSSGSGSMSITTTQQFSAGTFAGKYFLFSSGSTDYYGWFRVSGSGSDPNVASRTGVQINVNGDDTASEVATAAAAAIDALDEVNAIADGSALLIRSDGATSVTDGASGNSGLSVSVQAQGNVATFYPGLSVGSISNNP